MSFDLPESTLAAAQRARDDLRLRRPDERGMAVFAERAIFCEALLGAVKARFAELKLVVK